MSFRVVFFFSVDVKEVDDALRVAQIPNKKSTDGPKASDEFEKLKREESTSLRDI